LASVTPMTTYKFKFATLLGSSAMLALVTLGSAAQSRNTATTSTQPRVVAVSLETRSDYATSLESQLRSGGVDARVQLDGDSRDVLRIEWPSIHRSDVRSFVMSARAQHARQMGFGSVVFTNGKQRWDYDLARESMVWSPELF
jgi:hypothetical protein